MRAGMITEWKPHEKVTPKSCEAQHCESHYALLETAFQKTALLNPPRKKIGLQPHVIRRLRHYPAEIA